MDLENHHQQLYRDQQLNTGLLRFRSAPSSLFANSCDNLDSERLFARFMSSNNNDSDSLNFHDFEEISVAAAASRGDTVVVGVGDQRNCGNEYSLMNCRSELPPQYLRQSSATVTSPVGMDGAYGAVNSMRTTANLVRQNSSPAGIFSHLNAQNGYAAMRGAENFNVGNYEEVSPTVSRLGLLSQIGNESNGANSPEDVKFGNHDTRFYGSGFPVSSWTDSAQFMDEDEKLFSGTQNCDQKNGTRVLSHHLSLPKTSVETAAMEKLMQFQDSVPLKIRAKRGCATHPRSIAERVRRTRISERMRKLQELVPNMDKQTNTADMLDLAVDYIKDLQRQFKTLSDYRSKCKCSSTQRSIPNRTVSRAHVQITEYTAEDGKWIDKVPTRNHKLEERNTEDI